MTLIDTIRLIYLTFFDALQDKTSFSVIILYARDGFSENEKGKKLFAGGAKTKFSLTDQVCYFLARLVVR